MKSMLKLTLTLYLLINQIFGSPITSSPKIITDLNIINGNEGVPIDDTSFDSSPSSPGCPQAIEEYPWLYFGDPIPRCYLAGYRGPCPEGETLVIQPNSRYGSCACDCLSILVNVEYEQNLNTNSSVNRYTSCFNETSEVGPQGQVYDKMEGKCYSYYRQGPCPEGTIINHGRDEDKEISCRQLCSDLSGNDREVAEKRGECLPGMVAGISKIWTENGCIPGEKYSKILRKCIEDFSGKFNF